jgi:hypothetical protein
MPLLSAFAAGRWELIRSGWELSEHHDRRRTKAERVAALKRIAEIYGDAEEAREHTDGFVASWQGPPEKRQRQKWQGWWLPAEV